MLLSKSFRIRDKQVIAFVGGGGKTTAMFQLANELASQGKRVITTTTTRIFAAQIKLASQHFISTNNAGTLRDTQSALRNTHHVLIIGETQDDGKAFGVPPEFIDELIALNEVDAVLYEADGSRMRPFKAPAAHEPVIATSTTLLVPVVGINAIGVSLDEKNVHRPEIVAQIANAELGQPITPELVARVVRHPEGGLKNQPRDARVIVLVNQVETEKQLTAARDIAQRLLLPSSDGSHAVAGLGVKVQPTRYYTIDAVAIGAVENTSDPVHEVHRRVTAIIAAAGAGTRMQGRIKQLLPWRGKTLIENAIEIAAQSEANEIIVMLGANAEEINIHLSGSGSHVRPSDGVGAVAAKIIINQFWGEGHAATIRAALEALSPQTDAAIFINADQPLLTPNVVNAIIQRYRTTDASIVVPVYAGKRASPVLFQRKHFNELRALRGEQGGRELIAKNLERIEWVAFEDARLGADVDTIEEYESLE